MCDTWALKQISQPKKQMPSHRQLHMSRDILLIKTQMHFKPALLDNCVHPALQAYLDVFLYHHMECHLFLDHKKSEKLKHSHRLL